MTKQIKVSTYHSSITKIILDKLMALIGILALIPTVLIVAPLIKLTDFGPIFFTHKRTGKNGKVFKMIKFRSMRIGAESERGKKVLEKLNISDGPVFKIPNDPRLTKIGKLLFKSGLDELPQVINVLKGEMSIVGPRPLPVYEANKLTKSQRVRELVLPGITSSWVVSGAHNLKFKKWMKLDKEYVNSATLKTDITIIYKTALLLIKIGFRKLFNTLRK